ncbi:hypothetical protein TorRG33x02_036680 [Trema orientale]|uniref:Transmembrane protein n=1 Tax=Trema orientale TaxID=63057 RepID=A0A2P5FS61_TREOI|nr:hypothetical protein TorRG33x02_036680 [Trema orientale]
MKDEEEEEMDRKVLHLFITSTWKSSSYTWRPFQWFVLAGAQQLTKWTALIILSLWRTDVVWKSIMLNIILFLDRGWLLLMVLDCLPWILFGSRENVHRGN